MWPLAWTRLDAINLIPLLSVLGQQNKVSGILRFVSHDFTFTWAMIVPALEVFFIFSKQDHIKENCRRDVPQRFIICGKMVKPPDNHPCSSCLHPLHIPLVRLIIRMSTASTAVAGACIGPFTFFKNLETVSSLVQTPDIRTNLCHLLHCLWVNHLILIDVCFVAHSAFPSINDETCFFAMYTNLVLMIT